MSKINFIYGALLFAGLMAGCKETDYNAVLDVSNELPHYVYISSPTETILSATDMIDLGETEATFPFSIKYGVTDEKTATVEATVGVDFSLVAAYNKDKSKNYLPLPEVHVSFPSSSLNIASGSIETSVSWKLLNLDQLPNGEFLLPITIKSIKASNGFPIRESLKTAYYVITNQSAVLNSQWLFEDAANLGKATVGKDLQPVGSGFAQVEGPKGSKAVRIPKGSYYKATTEFANNGGGTKINEYTLVYDYRLTELGKWYCFLQTDPNNNGDGEYFLNTGGKLLNGNLGYSSEAVPQDLNWHRLIIVVKQPDFFKCYIDGEFFHEGSKGSLAIDNRYALDPTGILFCADEDGEDNDIDIGEIALYEGSMGEVRIKNLGGAGN